MKSTKEKLSADCTYPRLMQGTITGTIYLMSSDVAGVAVYSETDKVPVGYSSSKLSCLEPFKGTITLTED